VVPEGEDGAIDGIEQSRRCLRDATIDALRDVARADEDFSRERRRDLGAGRDLRATADRQCGGSGQAAGRASTRQADYCKKGQYPQHGSLHARTLVEEGIPRVWGIYRSALVRSPAGETLTLTDGIP